MYAVTGGELMNNTCSDRWGMDEICSDTCSDR